jgi:hypothetical protein
MTIMNRRNAVVGWITLKAGKAVARRQVKRAVSSKLASWRGGRDRDRRRQSGQKERAGRRSRSTA